jgi:hypothetical protein
MRLFHFVATALALLLGVLATDNGLQTDVEWDNGSLMVNGERVILMSGEFRKFAYTKAIQTYTDSMVWQTISAFPCLNYGPTTRLPKACTTSQPLRKMYNDCSTWPKRLGYM